VCVCVCQCKYSPVFMFLDNSWDDPEYIFINVCPQHVCVYVHTVISCYYDCDIHQMDIKDLVIDNDRESVCISYCRLANLLHISPLSYHNYFD